ncbi:histidine phosphotransferase family protein [Brevundimonas sp. NIBR11]|uniref:histidine phosphotransferase ChpT n=1 Tax=Brevundimonas sp. NIBR11 TaxID=3015999 RepID=UPI0022F121EA|nr:histidine phosphotransferase family protein [Brevundimonas sp. NIBR11]WGM30212.1 Protein phosphotransferase ChpT [Brevundimonas sp. NIBR11]
MTDAAVSAPSELPVDGQELASLIAAKLCHDFISPSGAIISGLDLLNDPTAQDMRDDAMSLIADSAKKMVALVQFCRVAFGAATTAERFTGAELTELVDNVVAGGRATLGWKLDAGDFGKPQARALVNLAYLIVGALPMGGAATVAVRHEGAQIVIDGIAEGARARLKAEAATGLSGRRLSEGLAGQWIQPYWLWLTADQHGGSLAVEAVEGRVSMTVRMPS